MVIDGILIEFLDKVKWVAIMLITWANTRH